jgi:hypothetical protein
MVHSDQPSFSYYFGQGPEVKEFSDLHTVTDNGMRFSEKCVFFQYQEDSGSEVITVM